LNINKINKILTKKWDEYRWLKALKRRLEYSIHWNTLDFLDTEYQENEINTFYNNIKSTCFAKWEEYTYLIENYWSEEIFKFLVETILIYSMNNNKNTENLMHDLSQVFVYINLFIAPTLLDDSKNLFSWSSKEMIESKNDFRSLSFQEYFYKYIFPNAITSKEKLDHYNDKEKQYVANLDLKSKTPEEMQKFIFESQYINLRRKTLQEKRLIIKEWFENAMKILYLFWKKQNEISPSEISASKFMKVELDNYWDKIFGSYCNVLHSMRVWKNIYKADVFPITSNYYYVDFIPYLVVCLWELLWDKEIEKIKDDYSFEKLLIELGNKYPSFKVK